MTDLSVIIPVYNELPCLDDLCARLDAALSPMAQSFEVLLVDDGSDDGSWEKMTALAGRYPYIRLLRLLPNSGQSAALGVGFRAAQGSIFVTLDADCQNDPVDIPRLVAELDHCDMCCGYREKRNDTWARRAGSRLANAVRNAALGEDIIDTGCTLKAARAELLRDLTMFHGMHRFLPALARMRGATIKQIPVKHHARVAGESKYTNMGRLKTVIADLMAVRWMKKRYRNFRVESGGPAAPESSHA